MANPHLDDLRHRFDRLRRPHRRAGACAVAVRAAAVPGALSDDYWQNVQDLFTRDVSTRVPRPLRLRRAGRLPLLHARGGPRRDLASVRGTRPIRWRPGRSSRPPPSDSARRAGSCSRWPFPSHPGLGPLPPGQHRRRRVGSPDHLHVRAGGRDADVRAPHDRAARQARAEGRPRDRSPDPVRPAPLRAFHREGTSIYVGHASREHGGRRLLRHHRAGRAARGPGRWATWPARDPGRAADGPPAGEPAHAPQRRAARRRPHAHA